MFDGSTEFTVNARRSISLARAAAHRLGHQQIDSGALVLGLLAERDGIAAAALAELEVSAAGVSAAIAASPLLNPGSGPLTNDLASALTAAARHSLNDDRGVTTGHLLLGAVTTAGGAGAAALGALGATPDLVRATVERLARAHPEGASMSAAVADVPLPPDPALPGRSAVAAAIASTVLLTTGAGAVIALSEPTLADAAVVAAAIGSGAATQLVVIGAVIVLVSAVVERRLGGRRRLTTPDVLGTVLARRGIRRLDLRAHVRSQRPNRCFRAGRRAWIVLSPATVRDPARLAFVLGHEVAHLARNDALRRRVELVLSLSLLYGAGFAASPTGWAVATATVTLLWLVPRWRAEFAADAVAVRWAGLDTMRHWAGSVRPSPRRLRRLAGLLTHPPLALRLRRAARA